MTSSLYRSNQWDVIISGGGVVGSLFALVLGSQPATRSLRVALLERDPPRDISTTTGPPIRVSAISPYSRSAFQRVGVWDELEPAATPYGNMVVWDTMIGGARVDFEQKNPDSPLGYVIPNNVMQHALYARLQELNDDQGSGLQLFCPATIKDIAFSSSNSWVGVQSDGVEEEMSARLVVGADGPGSYVKSAAKVETYGFGYQQEGVVAVVTTNENADARKSAWQRYLPTGPLGMLPLNGNQSSIVWSLPPADAARVKRMSKPDFVDLLNSCLSDTRETTSAYALPDSLRSVAHFVRRQPHADVPVIVDVVSDRVGFPLCLRNVSSYSGSRFALIGDAAHSVHPHAGQGLNLGIADAVDLANCFCRAYGRDIGSDAVLEEYSKSAYRRNVAMLLGIHGIYKSFNIDSTGHVAAIRNLGMDLVNASPDLKSFLAGVAMGNYFHKAT